MARSITFNGQTQYRPGGISKIDASDLLQIGLGANGIVGLIGESDGGYQPGEIFTIDDPALAKEYFRSGPLADAIGIAFDPTDDPKVPGGASRCLCIRVNATGSSRASLKVYNKVKEYTTTTGSTPTVLAFAASTFTEDQHNGSIVRIGTYSSGVWSAYEDCEITDTTETSLTVASPGFSVAPASGVTVHVFALMGTYYSKEYSAIANGIKQEYEPGASFGQAWTTAFEGKSQVSDDIGGISYLDLEYVGQREQVISTSGTALGTHSTTALQDTSKSWTINAYQNAFAFAELPTKNYRKITSNTADTLTVTNAFSEAPIDTDPYKVKIGAIVSSSDLLAERTFGAAGGASAATLSSTLNFAVNELANLTLVVTSGVASGAMRTITANTAGLSSVVTLSRDWESGKVPVATDTYEIRYVTIAHATIEGASGVATKLVTKVAANGAVTATTNLDITFTANQTLESLVNQINANSNYRAYVPSGINGQTTLMKTFDFDLGSYQVDIKNDRNSVTTPPSSTYSVPVTWPNHFRRDLQVLTDNINNINGYLTFTRAATAAYGSGSGRPAFTGGSSGTIGDTFQYLTGGTRGTSTNTDWQNAFDKLIQVRCNHVVPLICQDLVNEGYGSTATFASVLAMLAVHTSLGNGLAKSERGGYIGKKGTKTQVVQTANSINSTDIQLTSQRITGLNVSGTLTEFDEWSSAVVAAGMRSGMPEVGEPLTWKYFRTTALNQDSSWSPNDRTDANYFIQNGILFAEFIQGKGTRWVRDITTYVQDDNLAYMEGSMRDSCRYVSYGLRTFIEDRFTGNKAKPATATGIKSTAAEYLELARGENIIVDSTDDAGAFVRAYHNLRVNIVGDTARVRVAIFVAPGVNFELIEIFVKLPRQAA